MNRKVFGTAALLLIVAAIVAAQTGTGPASGPWRRDIGDPVINVICSIFLIIYLISGTVAVLVIVIAGIKWITSQDDPGARKVARTSILHALLGLCIILFAAAMVYMIGFETCEQLWRVVPEGAPPCCSTCNCLSAEECALCAMYGVTDCIPNFFGGGPWPEGRACMNYQTEYAECSNPGTIGADSECSRFCWSVCATKSVAERGRDRSVLDSIIGMFDLDLVNSYTNCRCGTNPYPPPAGMCYVDCKNNLVDVLL